MKLKLAILNLVLNLSTITRGQLDECKSLHPEGCQLLKEHVELFTDNEDACAQADFKRHCPSLCEPCESHDHHIEVTCRVDVDKDCTAKLAENETICQDLRMFMHCHQTCTKCEVPWTHIVLQRIGNTTEPTEEPTTVKPDDESEKPTTVKPDDECEDSSPICNNPKLLVAFLDSSQGEAQDACKEPAIQLICPKTCNKCDVPNSEVPTPDQWQEVQKLVVDQLLRIIDFFKDILNNFA